MLSSVTPSRSQITEIFGSCGEDSIVSLTSVIWWLSGSHVLRLVRCHILQLVDQFGRLRFVVGRAYESSAVFDDDPIVIDIALHLRTILKDDPGGAWMVPLNLPRTRTSSVLMLPVTAAPFPVVRCVQPILPTILSSTSTPASLEFFPGNPHVALLGDTVACRCYLRKGRIPARSTGYCNAFP